MYAAHGIDITNELMEHGECEHGHDGNGPLRGSDPPGLERSFEWNDAWREVLRRFGEGIEERISNQPKQREKVRAAKSQFQPYELEGCKMLWDKVS